MIYGICAIVHVVSYDFKLICTDVGHCQSCEKEWFKQSTIAMAGTNH